jgi:hypothetical protein
MTLPPLHIVFTMSGAVDLRNALAQDDRPDEVIALGDNLSFGPINPPDPSLRAHWIKTELGYEDLEDFLNDDAFWVTALSGDRRRIAWTSRRSTQEYAGFLEFVWRLQDVPCEFVDLTNLQLHPQHADKEPGTRGLVESLALLPAREISEHKLVELASPLTPPMRSELRAKWAKLREENSALRILDAQLELASAPISYFDGQLLSYVTDTWKKAARIVGEVMMHQLDVMQISDFVLAPRLQALAASGKLESQGDLSRIRFSEVRLPQKKRTGDPRSQ